MINHLEKEIVLDFSKENTSEPGFTVVETEIEFLRSEQEKAERVWVAGNLCNYVKNLYRLRKFVGITVRELKSPYLVIQDTFGINVNNLNQEFLEELLAIYKKEKIQKLGDLLAYLSNDNFWLENVSVEHAAYWLTINIDEKLIHLIEIQQVIWQKNTNDSELKKVYECKLINRTDYLKKWFFDEKLKEHLGTYPILLTPPYTELIKDEVGQRLRTTKGSAVLELPNRSINKKVYANAITEYFLYNSDNLNANLLAYSSLFLDAEQRTELEKLIILNSIEPLPPEVDYKIVLEWVTKHYLPFRQAELNKPALEQTKADKLAKSFTNWLLNNYPTLTNYDTEKSPVNVRTHHTVKELSENYWVLWVVVDGLNYLDHQKLLRLLSKHSNLKIMQDDSVFAVLPTITKRAKFGLTVGKFTSVNEDIEDDPNKYFLETFKNGVYTGNSAIDKLSEGLNNIDPKVCYWNFTDVDKIFHIYTNLVAANHAVEGTLISLANNIKYLVDNAHNPNRVAVVVCSDHGQMLRSCSKLKLDLTETFAHGRTALGILDNSNETAAKEYIISEDSETVYLNPKSFRLHESTTVCLKKGYFTDKKNNAEVIGVHGGLFPEETVLGLSVLVRNPDRKDIKAKITGSGETGKAGTIKIEIDNPNTAPINRLLLSIKGLKITEQAELFNAKVPAQQNLLFEIPINQFPGQQSNDEFIINGTLTYEFEEGVKLECVVSGKLICKTLYTAKNPNLRDRFKK